jgi:hypothetical protein
MASFSKFFPLVFFDWLLYLVQFKKRFVVISDVRVIGHSRKVGIGFDSWNISYFSGLSLQSYFKTGSSLEEQMHN